MARTRSPNYPVVDLAVAIDLIGKLEKFAQRHPAPADAVIEKAWGFKAQGSYGYQCVAALRQFGLILEEDGTANRQIRLSDDGAKIVHNHPDKAALLRAAASKPRVHANIFAKYQDGLPPDDTIKTYLLFDHQPPFNPAAVPDFLKQLRQTVAYAALDLSEVVGENKPIEPDKDGSKPEHEPLIPDGTKRNEIKRPPLKSGMTQATYPLAEGDALLQIPENLSQESYEDFETWVNLLLKTAKRSIVKPSTDTEE